MYRVMRSEGIECEVDLYVAPSPRTSTKVVRVALAMAVVPCVIGWLMFYFVHISLAPNAPAAVRAVGVDFPRDGQHRPCV